MGLSQKSALVLVGVAFASSVVLAQEGKSDINKMIAEGRKVFATQSLGNCLGCHSVQNDPMDQTGNLGPHLANMDVYPKEYLLEKIMDPNKSNPNTIMPPTGRNHKITKEQAEAVVAYLRTTAKSKKGE